MIVIRGRAGDQVARVIQALAVHVGKSGDLNIGAGDGLMHQLGSALSGADDADPHAVVRA